MRAFRSELVKLTTTRLPVWLLLASATLAFLLVFVTVPTRSAGAGDALHLYDPDLLARVTGVAVGGAEVLMLVLGVLAYTQELRFGTISGTLLATPSRSRVLFAKIGAIAVAALVFWVAIAAVSVIASAAFISGRGGTLTWSTGLIEVIGGIAATLVLYGVLGVAVGAVVQNQIAAIVGSLIWLLVVEQLLMALFPAVGRWTFAGTTSALVQLGRASTYDTRPSFAAGSALLVAYTAILVGAALLVTSHRDIT